MLWNYSSFFLMLIALTLCSEAKWHKCCPEKKNQEIKELAYSMLAPACEIDRLFRTE